MYRSYCAGVKAGCEDEDIFRFLEAPGRPPWVLELDECLEIDKAMTRVIGSFASDEVPLNIMRAGKCEKSHDTIHWAHTFSRWCLGNKGEYTDNVLDIFDIMSILNSSRLDAPTIMTETYTKLIDALIKRSGLLPPSECCVTLHELIHVLEQVEHVGTPRHSTLYKFEMMNKIMKSMVKNKARGRGRRVGLFIMLYLYIY